MCICLKDTKSNSFTFSLQWHLTAKCDQRCKHCYMFDSPFYKSELENELKFSDCKAIIDDFTETLKLWNKKGGLFFTGGDPLLREDFFEILKYANDKNIFPIGVMGNPYHIDEETASKLKNSGVLTYQMSLDGLRDTHDFFRKKGSFNNTLRAYEILKKAGVSPVCMFTVSKANQHELLEVIRLVASLKLAAFDFDRLVPVGSGSKLSDDILDADEYKELLIQVNEEYKRLRKSGCQTQFGYKDNLWSMVQGIDENSIYQTLVPKGFQAVRGCIIGKSGLAVLADGSVMACRRLPIKIGNLPKQKIKDIFEGTELVKLKNMSDIPKCKSCDKSDLCKGCRAVAYGASGGNYLSDDPQCWGNNSNYLK